MSYSPEEDERIAFFKGDAEQIGKLQNMAEGLGVTSMAATAAHTDYNQLPPQEHERQKSLDAPFHTAVVPSVMTNAHQLIERLNHNGIRTIRDVLVLGRSRVNHGIATITPDQLDKMARGIVLNFPHETFREKPSIEDIAGICVGIDQVHGGVLPAYTAYIKRRRSEIMQASRRIPIAPDFLDIRAYRASLRVSEFLTDTLISPPENYLGRKPSDLMPTRDFDTIRAEALPFAFTFADKRRRLDEAN
jgi:hypothetical protein